MPRRKNPACISCAADSIEVAQAKSCWDTENPKTCRSKRTYYKKHSVNKAKKRSKQRGDRVEKIKELDIPLFGLQTTPEVLMTFFRDRADGPIHAISFSVVEDGKTVTNVKPIHLKGVPQSKLRRHIKNVLGVLNAQFGHELPVNKDKQPVKLCPLCLKKEEGE
ncbi:MAG: hypothetical protein WA885_19240 [Phormidesmis sp.]